MGKQNQIRTKLHEMIKKHVPELMVRPKKRHSGKDLFVMTFGSNYEIFSDRKCDEKSCPAGDETLKLRDPSNAMLDAFEAMLQLYMELSLEKGIPCSSIVMPSDIVRANEEELDALRNRCRFRLPGFGQVTRRICPMPYQSRPKIDDPFLWEISRIGLQNGAYLFAFESEYRKLAGQALRDMVSGKVELPENAEIKTGGRYGRSVVLLLKDRQGLVEARINLGFFERKGDESSLVPKCALICAKFLEELDKKLRVTHLISVFEGNDYFCVNSGIQIAYALLGIRMRILIAGVREADGKTELFDSEFHDANAYEDFSKVEA